MPTKPPKSLPADPSQIPEFDRAMRTIVGVKKSDVEASIAKERAKKKSKSTK